MCQNNSQSWLPREEQRSAPKPQMNSSRSNDDAKTTVMLKDETTATTITRVETPTTFKTIAHDREGKTVTIVHFDELPHWMQCDPYISTATAALRTASGRASGPCFIRTMS